MEVLAFSSECNTILNSIENICRRINATREPDSHVPALTRCASCDALEHCHQRLRTIYLERLLEAVREAERDPAHHELAAAPINLAGPARSVISACSSRETTASPDVCDKQLRSALRRSSLEDNAQRRVARGGSIERGVSWNGNLEAVCVIPGRHSADVLLKPRHVKGRHSQNEPAKSGSAFTKPGQEFMRKLRKLRGQLLFSTTGAAAASRSGAKLRKTTCSV